MDVIKKLKYLNKGIICVSGVMKAEWTSFFSVSSAHIARSRFLNRSEPNAFLMNSRAELWHTFTLDMNERDSNEAVGTR